MRVVVRELGVIAVTTGLYLPRRGAKLWCLTGRPAGFLEPAIKRATELRHDLAAWNAPRRAGESAQWLFMSGPTVSLAADHQTMWKSGGCRCCHLQRREPTGQQGPRCGVSKLIRAIVKPELIQETGIDYERDREQGTLQCFAPIKAEKIRAPINGRFCGI